MSATTSATSGRRYGLERVCRMWERSRSALYARRARLQRPARGAGPGGAAGQRPRCRMRSCWRPFAATWPAPRSRARGIARSTRGCGSSTGRVSRTRVLRVMRAQGLLSPHRGRQDDPKAHDGTIVTTAPDVMWGTDGVRVFTADEGWVWTFAAVDHWNAECVSWHVCKVGSRFAALEPVAQGLRRLYGSVEADVARGLALRMDHGSQYLSDHFLNQLRYWGIHPSFGFLEEPETNGGRRALESHAQGASSLRPGLPKPGRSARRRRRVRRTLQSVLAPREAGVPHAARSARGTRAASSRVA